MGSPKPQTIGYHYRPAYHVVIGRGPIDVFLEFRAAEKVAWNGGAQIYSVRGDGAIKYNANGEIVIGGVIPATGPLYASGRIEIARPNLFGGEKDQGGILGPVDVMFGEPGQLPNPYLQEVFGEQTAAWRGVTTLAFCGGRYGAMNPMPQKPAYKIQKIFNGWDGGTPWYPEVAAVPVGSHTISGPTSMYIALDVSGSMAGTRLAVLKEAMGYVFDTLAGWITGNSPQIDVRVVAWSSGSAHMDEIPLTLEGISRLRTFVDGLSAGGGTSATAAYGGVQAFMEASGLGQHVVVCLSDGAMSNVPEAVGMIDDAVAAVGPIAMRGIGIAVPGSLHRFDNSGGPIPVVSGENAEEAAEVILRALASTAPVLGMNPAHMLVYSRTDSEMGREPMASINQASLQAAALRLFTEGFGLCASFDPSSDTPDGFEQRICQLIGGNFERSIVDGQYYLDLARGDYDIESLPVINDDDILEFKELPTTLERTVNSLSVRYFDPTSKETVITPAVRALGLIRQFGEIHETLDCPEIPSGSLALRKAETELRARITPTRAFDVVTTPRSKALRRNQYFRLQSPKRRIADMVCIVGERQLGTLKSGAIRWKFAQDIYRLADASYAEIEEGVDTTPSDRPDPIELARPYEAPYVDLVSALPRAELDALAPDAGFLVGVAAQPGNGQDFTMCVRVSGDDFRLAGNGEWCPTALAVDAVSDDPEPVEVALASPSRLSAVPVGGLVMWDAELCRVDAIDRAAPSVTLARGCVDTIAAEHAADSRLWFVTEAAVDTIDYAEGESIDVAFVNNTGTSQYPIAAALQLPLEFVGRAARPYPPGRVRIDGEVAPTAITGEFELTWAHRDRLLQADQLVDTEAASIGPEPTGRYGIRLLDDQDDVLIQRGDVAGEIATIDLAYTGDVTLELFAVNDNGVSMQWHRRTFAYTADAATEHVIDADTYEPEYTIIDGGEVGGG